MSTLNSELLFEIFVSLEAPIDLGAGPEGHRLVVIATGGKFSGPKLSGKVLANSGGDWLRLRPDGSGAIDVRLNLQTDDGADIYMSYLGRAVFSSQEQMATALNFFSDDPIDSSEYYFRTTPYFETSHPDYSWMNGLVSVGIGSLGHGGVTYQVYAIK